MGLMKGYRKVHILDFHGFVKEPWPASISLQELLPEIGRAAGTIIKMRANRAIKIREGLHLKEEFLRGWQSWPLWLKGLLGRGRLRRQWRASLIAQERGIPTPEPLAYLESKQGLVPFKSVLVTRYAGGFSTLTHYLQGKTRDEAWISQQGRAFLRGLADIVRGMHKKGMVHHDLKGSNILVKEEGEAWEFLFTDSKASRFGDRDEGKVEAQKRTGERDIVRLLATLRTFFPASERGFFLESYLSCGPQEARPLISRWEAESLRFPSPRQPNDEQK